jgi:hypothetical protein
MKKFILLFFVVALNSAFAFQSANEISGSFFITENHSTPHYANSDMGSFQSENNHRSIASTKTEVYALGENGVSGSFEIID